MTTCKVCHRERFIKAAGMCRTCREKHLNKRMRAIGDAKPRAVELIDHYGSVGTAARMIGLARNTLVRIQHAELDARIQRAAYSAIMNHKTSEQKAAQERPEPATWAEAAAYARTPEGQAYIKRCRLPRSYRLASKAVAA